MQGKLFRLAALLVTLAGPASAQVAILQIQVVEGDGAVHVPGSRDLHPFAVAITDETGKPVEGAAVSFHLPDDGPTGSFFNGLRTEVILTDAAGRASLRGLAVNRVPGRFEIRIIASKEQSRAGVISFQYIAEPRRGAAAVSARVPATPPSTSGGASQDRHRSSVKWIAIAALIAGAAAAGIVSAAHSGGASTAIASAPSTPTLSIGPPTITVGKP